MPDSNSPDYDQILEMMKAEFIDEANEVLNTIDIIIENARSNTGDEKDDIRTLFRHAHSLKGSAGLVKFSTVGVIMHSMEDYMSKTKSLNEKVLNDLQVFSDKARDSIENGTSINEKDLFRQLPKFSDGEEATADSDAKNLTVLLAINDAISGKIFEKEFSKHGLRTFTARSSFETIEMTVRVKPDLVVLSGVIDELSGVDVSNAIKAMPATKNIPTTVMTSFDRDHPDLVGLPESVSIISKNNLSGDLENILKNGIAK